MDNNFNENNKGNSKVIQIITIIVLVLLLGVGGFIIYKEYSNKNDNDNTSSSEVFSTEDNKPTFNLDNFDGTKAINTNSKYSLLHSSNNELVTPTINDDNSVNVSITLSKYKEIGILNNNLLSNEANIVLKTTAFDQKVLSVVVAKSDQSYGYETVFYVLADGSLYYSYVLKSLNSITSLTNATIQLTKIGDVNNIMTIRQAQIADDNFDMTTFIAIRNDGLFYDLNYIINDAY